VKVLYAIQGTGNGHVSRATEIIPVLQRFSECDILISGSENEINPGFPIQFKAKGLGFAFGRNGGIDVLQTLRKADFIQLWKEIRTVPVEDYDLVINDFEPVTARACKLKKVPCIGLSHQGSLLSDKVPRPRTRDWKGPLIIRHYAPVNIHFGFHFLAYDGNIFTPVIRSAVRNHVVEDGGHYTVYLPAWDDQFLIRFLEQFEGIRWQVFSKRAKKSYQHGHLSIFPVSGSAFTRSMASSTGVLCGAGFETPAEALFLGKKLMVLPMKGQYEQHCNAQALAALGVRVIYNLDGRSSWKVREWLASENRVSVCYPNQTEAIVKAVLEYAEKTLLRPRMVPAFG